MVLPSCAVNKIRSAFSSSSYARFKYPNLGTQGLIDQLRTGKKTTLITQLFNDDINIFLIMNMLSYLFIAESFHFMLDLNIFIHKYIGLMHYNVTN